MRIWITAFADLTTDKGNTRHIRELLAGLRSRGHEVTLLVSRQKPTPDEANVVAVPSPQIPVPGLRYLSGLISFQILLMWRMARLFRRGRPDVIYARHDAFLAAPALFARLARLPLVSELNGILPFELHLRGHGRIGIRINEWIERRVYRRSRRIVVVAEGIGRYLADHLGVDPAKIAVSPNGADLERFTPGDGGDVRRRIGAGRDDVVIGYVGGLQPYQGVDRLLECAAALVQRGLPIRLLIVGDGPERGRLERLAGEGPLAGRATFTGTVAHAEVPACIRAMDLCALTKLGRVEGSPHAYSASPLKAFEYLACARPIVSGDLPDLRFLEEAGAALCADVEDRGAFTDALDRLARDAELRERMGEAGRRYAAEHGSWDASVGRVEDILAGAVS